VTPQGAYGHNAPQVSGGFDFHPDPMTPSYASALEGTVARGMARPQGQHGGIDVMSLLAGDGGDLWNDDDQRTAVPRTTTPRRSGPMGFLIRG
jgi:hypothetical protein